MPRESFIDAAASAARRPPFTAETCLRTALISLIGAPQPTSSRCSSRISSSVTARIQRQFHQRRAAARKQKKYQRARIASREQIDDGPRRHHAPLIRHGMRRADGPKSPHFGHTFVRRHQDAFEREIVGKEFREAARHGHRRFADGDRRDAAVRRHVDRAVAERDPRAGPRQLLVHGCGDIDAGESFGKDFARDLLQVSQEVSSLGRGIAAVIAAACSSGRGRRCCVRDLRPYFRIHQIRRPPAGEERHDVLHRHHRHSRPRLHRCRC